MGMRISHKYFGALRPDRGSGFNELKQGLQPDHFARLTAALYDHALIELNNSQKISKPLIYKDTIKTILIISGDDTIKTRIGEALKNTDKKLIFLNGEDINAAVSSYKLNNIDMLLVDFSCKNWQAIIEQLNALAFQPRHWSVVFSKDDLPLETKRQILEIPGIALHGSDLGAQIFRLSDDDINLQNKSNSDEYNPVGGILVDIANKYKKAGRPESIAGMLVVEEEELGMRQSLTNHLRELGKLYGLKKLTDWPGVAEVNVLNVFYINLKDPDHEPRQIECLIKGYATNTQIIFLKDSKLAEKIRSQNYQGYIILVADSADVNNPCPSCDYSTTPANFEDFLKDFFIR